MNEPEKMSMSVIIIVRGAGAEVRPRCGHDKEKEHWERYIKYTAQNNISKKITEEIIKIIIR